MKIKCTPYPYSSPSDTIHLLHFLELLCIEMHNLDIPFTHIILLPTKMRN